MSKWRPIIDKSCIYVIPDIRGNCSLLDKILKRILPLRSTDGIQDKIIFLGNYINYHRDSHKVLDRLISLKKEFSDNIICLFGYNEYSFLEAMEIISIPDKNYGELKRKLWMFNGGLQTVSGYIERNSIKENPLDLSKDRILDLIPKEHIEFLVNDLVPYFEYENFIFVHAGLDGSKPIESCSLNSFVSDYKLINDIVLQLKNKIIPKFEKTIVTGHHYSISKGKPILTDNFIMLDCASPKQLLIMEIKTRLCFMAFNNKNRLVSYNTKKLKNFL